MRRTDSKPRTHFRAPTRLYQEAGGAWYYSTREGEHGPFAKREDAEADARLYVGLQAHLSQAKEKVRSTG